MKMKRILSIVLVVITALSLSSWATLPDGGQSGAVQAGETALVPASSTASAGLRVDTERIWEIFHYKSYKMVASGILYKEFEDIAGILNSVSVVKMMPKTEPQFELMVVMDDYKKIFVKVWKDTIAIDNKAYSLTNTQFQSLKKGLVDTPEVVPQWLTYMNPNRVVSATYYQEDGEIVGVNDSSVFAAAEGLRHLVVEREDARSYKRGTKEFQAGEGKVIYEFFFDSGVYYTLVVDGNTLYLESSDMENGYSYTMKDGVADAFEEAFAHFTSSGTGNPTTAKPVIYLYPEEKQQVDVKLNFTGFIAYTYPTYDNGWRVTADTDGTLVNHADSSTHYYLFWDGYALRKEWDFSKGFVVAGDDVEEFFLEKLKYMGLTPREYNDFIVYWAPILSQNKYNLITFATEEYDEISKLTVTPAPDTIFRVHMVYKPINYPVSIQAQTLPRLERKGFTVLEWGGTLAENLDK